MRKKPVALAAVGLACGIVGLFIFLDQHSSGSATSPPLAEAAPLDVGITLPLQMLLNSQTEAASGQIVPVHFTGALHMPEAEVTLKFTWPRTAQLVSGKAQWHGVLRQDEDLHLDFALRLAGTEAGYVLAQAEVVPSGGRTFSQGTSLYLDPLRRTKTETTQPVQGYAGASQIRVYRANAAQK